MHGATIKIPLRISGTIFAHVITSPCTSVSYTFQVGTHSYIIKAYMDILKANSFIENVKHW
jgi:hypothetical protein